jgi:glucose/arabinose dehydrogenase
MSLRGALRSVLAGTLLAGVLVAVAAEPVTTRTTVQPGFQEQVVFTGLTAPTNIELSPDGRVFVAQKNGVVKVFDDVADPTPTDFADLSVGSHDQWDRGLLGLALAPGFPTDPWVYVLYTYDAPPGQTAPAWNDVCADPGGGGCVVTARLSRLRASGDELAGTEQTLVADWCQQYPGHSVGDLHFGADGALYVSSGDGASGTFVDYGQTGSPADPCGDPPSGRTTPLAAEGGALRAQDVRTAGDPTGLDGTVLRLDPNTGAALPDNPLAASRDANTRRVVAYGLRNPFRFAIRPGTSEVWLGDAGWDGWEELDRVNVPTGAVANLGWPCYEGGERQRRYDRADLGLCERLYTGGGTTPPYFTYRHTAPVVPGDACATGSSSVTGLAFYPGTGGPYPAMFNGALFFADFGRGCIWAMLRGGDGLPDPHTVVAVTSGAAAPVDLAIGPGGELYYVDLGGTVRRIRYVPGNEPPVAVLAATPVSGTAPLTVSFDGRNAGDADPADRGRLTYAWDFTDDGSVDATTPTGSFTYRAGRYTARLTVTDTLGATNTTTVTISAGTDLPTAVIDSPAASFTWAAGDTVTFSGHATDPRRGRLPASALTWYTVLHHCVTPTSCDSRQMNTYTGVSRGSFTAPAAGYPSYLEVRLTATDASGRSSTASVSVNPKATSTGRPATTA